MAIPGLVAASNLADAENKEAVWDNLGNGIDAVILATNSIRNNTMVGAVAGTPGTTPTNWSAGSFYGLTREIVATGVEDGIAYIDCRFFGTTTSILFESTFFESPTQISATQGSIWTLSAYLRIVGGSTLNITRILLVIVNHSSAGTSLSQFAVSTAAAPTSAPLNSQRYSTSSFSGTFSNANTAFVRPYVQIEANSGVAIDITLRIGLPQLERGEYVTPPIATTNAPASALATVPLSIKGDDILELIGARLAATSDFVRIKGLTTLAQPRLTTAAANVASGTALRDNALLKASPSSEGDYFLSRGTLDGQSLRVNGLSIASLSGSPFSGSTASCPLLISSFAAPTNLRLDNAMASGTLAFPERAIPIETDQFIFYAKAGQS
jgi:hypothetical protein